MENLDQGFGACRIVEGCSGWRIAIAQCLGNAGLGVEFIEQFARGGFDTAGGWNDFDLAVFIVAFGNQSLDHVG